MKILSFTHPNVIPNLYDFLFSVEHKIKYFKSLYLLFLDTSDFQCMEKNKFLKISSLIKRVARFSFLGEIKTLNHYIDIWFRCNSVNISAVDSPTESTDAWTPHSSTSVIMDLRITNRVYNDSLADQQSEEYTTLKQELEQLVRVSS